MGKVTKIIHVEQDDWDALPSGERSEIIRKFMHDYHLTLKANINDINLELLQMQVNTLESQRAKIESELQSKRSLLSKALKIDEERKLKDLEAQKKRVEEANKCICCKKIFNPKEKRLTFSRGFVCNSCFQNYGTDKYKEWSMEAI